MRGTSTSALIIVATVVAVAALAGLAVIRMGEAAGGGVSASVNLIEQEGIATATIEVLRGSIAGVAIRYAIQNGSVLWAKPLYCMAVNNTAEVTPTAVYFSKPVSAGQAVTCTFYVWAPSTGTYNLWVLGYRPGGAGSTVLAQLHMPISATPPLRAQYASGPANATWPILPKIPKPIGPPYYNYTLIPITWGGQGVVKIKVTWGYTFGFDDEGLYISLFVPTNYTTVVATSSDYRYGRSLYLFFYGGDNYVPAGSSLQLFVQFVTRVLGSGWIGAIQFAVMNANGGYGVVQPTGFNPNMYWPTNTWTTYVIYNSTSNALSVEWIVPGVFDVKYTYDLNTFGSGSYRFTPPPPGQYYIVVGVATGGGYYHADWQVYSISYSVS